MKIEILRAEIREPGVNVPGAEVGSYAGRERVLQDADHPLKRLTQKQHVVMWHDGEFLYVANPERAAEPEVVPMVNVLQMYPKPIVEKAKK